jgi:hypothetical protein
MQPKQRYAAQIARCIACYNCANDILGRGQWRAIKRSNAQEHDVSGGCEFQPIEDGRYKVWEYDANQDKLEGLHASP